MTASAALDLDGIVWEETTCPLCMAQDEEEILVTGSPCGRATYRVARCRRCAMAYLNPRPDEASIGRLYPDDYTWYHPPAPGGREGWKQRLRRLVMARYFGTPPGPRGWGERILAWLGSWWLYPRPETMTALPFQGEGRLLDYGCGSGWYARQMRDLGWKVTGMDFSAFAAGRVQQHFGIPTLTGSLPHPQVRPGSFDAITMGSVLEHVHDPHRLIGAAAAALAPGGYLAVSVPNFASWGFRYFGQDWWGLQLPHHLLHFTPETLAHLLRTHGLEVRRLRQIPRAGWMQRSMRAARQTETTSRRWLVKLGRVRLLSSSLARWSARQGGADCIEVLAYRRGDAAPTAQAA